MKRLIYLIAFTGIVLSSCVKTNEGVEPNDNRKYSFAVSAEKAEELNDLSGTRIDEIDDRLHWSVGDKVGVLVVTESLMSMPLSASSIVNLPMTGQHLEPTTKAYFKGELTFEQISGLHPDTLYHYITYYPYLERFGFEENWSEYLFSAAYLSIAFRVSTAPGVISVRSNTFPTHTLKLIGMQGYLPPMTWLDEEGVQQWSEMAFTYICDYSHLRLKIESNAVNDMQVNSIELDVNGNFITCAREEIDPETGELSYTLTSNHTIRIEDGMDVGDVIYIPLQGHDYSESDMTFKFTFEDGSTWSKTIKGSIAETGKIHNVGFNIR